MLGPVSVLPGRYASMIFEQLVKKFHVLIPAVVCDIFDRMIGRLQHPAAELDPAVLQILEERASRPFFEQPLKLAHAQAASGGQVRECQRLAAILFDVMKNVVKGGLHIVLRLPTG